MVRTLRHPRRIALGSALATLLVCMLAVPGLTAAGGGGSITNERGLRSEAKAAEEEDEVLGIAYSFAAVATAPAVTVDSAALIGAAATADALPVVGGSWSELQNTNYNNDNTNYRDPIISNGGAGCWRARGNTCADSASRTRPSSSPIQPSARFT